MIRAVGRLTPGASSDLGANNTTEVSPRRAETRPRVSDVRSIDRVLTEAHPMIRNPSPPRP